MTHPYKKYENTKNWETIRVALSDLMENQDITITTLPEYVIGYICKKLDSEITIEVNDRIKLKTYNKTSMAPKGCHEFENYWKLIGHTGKVVRDPEQNTIFSDFSKEQRVLIQFDDNVESLNLHCHNNIKNSLWILLDDLEILG